MSSKFIPPLCPLYTGGSFRYVVKFRRRRNGSRYALATSEQIATRFNCVSVTYPAGQHLFHSYSRQLNMRCGRAVNMDGVVATRFSRVRCVYATLMEILRRSLLRHYYALFRRRSHYVDFEHAQSPRSGSAV